MAFLAAEILLLVLIVVAARIVRDEIRARERAMQVQQRLMGIVSHDLRNPLHAVLGSAWSLGRQELPGDARRAVQRIGSAGRRMHRLIRDVLDWSRAHAGAAIPIAPREADLFELCARVADDLDRPAGERIQLVCPFGSSTSITSSARELQRAFVTVLARSGAHITDELAKELIERVSAGRCCVRGVPPMSCAWRGA